MTNIFQTSSIVIFGFISLLTSIKGLYEVLKKHNPFGETPLLFGLGIFVWGDAVIFGPFWLLTALIGFLLKNWYLFLLIISVFWIVRSVGETIYWLNQQFSPINRNPPERLRGYRLFKNDSLWFVYQIFWQCVTVVSVVATIYLANLCLEN